MSDRISKLLGFEQDEPMVDRLAGFLQSPLMTMSANMMDGRPMGYSMASMAAPMQQQQQLALARKIEQIQGAQAPQVQPQQPQAPQPMAQPTAGGPSGPLAQGGQSPTAIGSPNQNPRSPSPVSSGSSTQISDQKMRQIATAFMVEGTERQKMFGANILNDLDTKATARSAQEYRFEQGQQRWLLDKMYENRQNEIKRKHEFDKIRRSHLSKMGLAKFNQGAQDRRLGIKQEGDIALQSVRDNAAAQRAAFLEQGRNRRASMNEHGRMSRAQARMDFDKSKVRAKNIQELRNDVGDLGGLMGLFEDVTNYSQQATTGPVFGRIAANLGPFVGAGEDTRMYHMILNENVLNSVRKLPGHLSNADLKFLQNSSLSPTDEPSIARKYVGRGYRGLYYAMRKAAARAQELGERDLAAQYSQVAQQAYTYGQIMLKDSGTSMDVVPDGVN